MKAYTALALCSVQALTFAPLDTEDVQLTNQQKLFKYSDTIANADAADDKELGEEEDHNTAIVDINGWGNSRFHMNEPLDYMVPATHILPGHFGTVPRVELAEPILIDVTRYSDDLANGDSSDDKDLSEEEDEMNDNVDMNGSGRFRFAMNEPLDYMVPATHIHDDHFGTVPRSDNPYDSTK